MYSHEWTDEGHHRRGHSRSRATRRAGEGEVGEAWSDLASSALLVLGGWRVEVARWLPARWMEARGGRDGEAPDGAVCGGREVAE